VWTVYIPQHNADIANVTLKAIGGEVQPALGFSL
jgi:hypothetical protein